jgi:hypothetical protein
MSEPLKDVWAVSLETGKVRLMAESLTEKNAEAVVSMAVMRRGVDEEFFGTAPHGKYKEGDKWKGQK